MADFQFALAAGINAVDELCLWQGQPTISSKLNSIAALQTQLTAANNALALMTVERNARQTAINNMKAAAQAEGAADAAVVAGQSVINAAGGF
jgi:hypothetical protein